MPIRRSNLRKPTQCVSRDAWCGDVIKTAKDDEPWFQMVVCHPPGSAEPAQLTFETTREVDFAIVDLATGEEVWRWSTPEPEPEPDEHVLYGQVGWCFVWTAVWNGLGDNGRELPPGEYSVLGEVLSKEPVDVTDDRWQVQ